MRVVVINTGTELLLGEVLNTHLRFIAREIFQFGLRVDEQRTVPDSPTLQEAFAEIFPRAEVIFVTGGLGPTSDDITRELVSDFFTSPRNNKPPSRSPQDSRNETHLATSARSARRSSLA